MSSNDEVSENDQEAMGDVVKITMKMAKAHATDNPVLYAECIGDVVEFGPREFGRLLFSMMNQTGSTQAVAAMTAAVIEDGATQELFDDFADRHALGVPDVDMPPNTTLTAMAGDMVMAVSRLCKVCGQDGTHHSRCPRQVLN